MRYKRFAALGLALCLALLFTACNLKPAAPWPSLRPGGPVVRGSGHVADAKTPLPADERGFALRVTGFSFRGSGGAGVELVIDETLAREVVVTADDNINERISVRCDVELREIVVELARRTILAPTKLVITVGAPVRALVIDGAWRFTYNCPGVKGCEVDVNGAANGKLTFGALDSLRVDVNGASDIKLAGAAKRADLTVNGAANIKAFDLAAVIADVTINGAGGCEITAVEVLDAQINGVGKVVYGGKPVVHKRIHGLGEVRAK